MNISRTEALAVHTEKSLSLYLCVCSDRDCKYKGSSFKPALLLCEPGQVISAVWITVSSFVKQ